MDFTNSSTFLKDDLDTIEKQPLLFSSEDELMSDEVMDTTTELPCLLAPPEAPQAETRSATGTPPPAPNRPSRLSKLRAAMILFLATIPPIITLLLLRHDKEYLCHDHDTAVYLLGIVTGSMAFGSVCLIDFCLALIITEPELLALVKTVTGWVWSTIVGGLYGLMFIGFCDLKKEMH